MKSYPYSRLISRRSGSNFYYAFFFLPKRKREGLMSVYAFSRLVDDSVDEASDERLAQEQIRLWRKRVHLCFNGSGSSDTQECDHPLLPELSETIRRFQIPEKYFLDLLSGVEMDLTRKRYENFHDLQNYCYHVAGVVGLLFNHLFGIEGKRGEQYAIHLGTAFQLTNILRDVGNDAERGRIYLPREDLIRFGVAESDLLEGKTTPQFFDLMEFQARRIDGFFQKAFEALPQFERKKIIPAEIMSAFYQKILQMLREEKFPIFAKKIELSRRKKLGLVLKVVTRSMI